LAELEDSVMFGILVTSIEIWSRGSIHMANNERKEESHEKAMGFRRNFTNVDSDADRTEQRIFGKRGEQGGMYRMVQG
jgi:hypothetical protein